MRNDSGHGRRFGRALAVALTLTLSMTTLPSGSLKLIAATDTAKKQVEKVEVQDKQVQANSYGLQNKVQGSNILHCWNWSYSTIEAHMQLIAECGYTAIQTSPAQQPKDYNYSYVDKTTGQTITVNGDEEGGREVGWPGRGGTGNWWKLYQPVTFDVCDNGHTWLGTKAELESMCATAEKYGIKVIVDIVANHMGNITGWKNSLSDVSPQVGEFWNKDMLTDESYWHINDRQVWMSDGREDFTQGTMGMPDLNTANKTVQKYVYDYLDELIDCGVDGFRFDAAKHIETPDDGSFASDFWPTVLNEAKGHYKSKTGGDLYVYGEVLNTVGDNFSIDSYTKYMSVTDNSAGNHLLEAFRNNNAGALSMDYASDKSVLWAESHDTYMNESSRYASDRSIVRTWAMVGNKKDAASLFFVRPYYSKDTLLDDRDGSFNDNMVKTVEPALMGACSTYVWASKEVAAINHFNNRFANDADVSGADGNIAYCKRGNGIILASFGGPGEVSTSAHGLPDGSYVDEVSGNTFKVSGGTVSGNITSEYGVAVIYQNVMPNPSTSYPITVDKPVIQTTYPNGTILGEKEITYTVKNADSASYSIDGEKETSFSDSVTLTIGKGLNEGDTCTVKITATKDGKTTAQKYTYTIGANKPQLSITPEEDTEFSDTIDVTVAAENTVKATYQIGKAEPVEFTEKKTFTIGEDMQEGDTVTVTVYGKSSNGREDTKTVTFTKTEEDTSTYVYFKNTKGWDKVDAYAWTDGAGNNADWPGKEMTLVDEKNKIYAIDLGKEQYQNIIFSCGGDEKTKTKDLTLPGLGQIYDMDKGTWSAYEVKKPTISASQQSGTVAAGTKITYQVKDAEKATVSVNGGKEESFEETTTFTVGDSGTDTVVITATNGSKTVKRTYEYTVETTKPTDTPESDKTTSPTEYKVSLSTKTAMYDGKAQDLYECKATDATDIQYKVDGKAVEKPSFTEVGKYKLEVIATFPDGSKKSAEGTVMVAAYLVGDTYFVDFDEALAYAKGQKKAVTIQMAGKTTISKQTDLTADITLKAYNSTGKLSIDKNATLQNGKLEIDTQNDGIMENVEVASGVIVTGDGKQIEKTTDPDVTKKPQQTPAVNTPTPTTPAIDHEKETPIPSPTATSTVAPSPTATHPSYDSDFAISVFRVAPSLSQVKNKTVKITVRATGGVGVYFYRYEIYNSKNERVAYKKYTEGLTSCNWKANKAGTYKIKVYAKDEDGVVVTKTKTFTIVSKKLSVATTKNTTVKLKKGKTATVKVKASGGKKAYKYKFTVYTYAGKRVTYSKYRTNTIWKWKATKAGNYKIVVTVKDSTGTTIAKTVKKVIVK